jgi:hypothetical protein
MRQRILAAALMCSVVVACSQWGDSQRSRLPLSEIAEDCTATTTEVRFTIKAGGEEYPGKSTVVDGTSVASWSHPKGTSGSEASAISNITFCDPSYSGKIKGTGKVSAGCVKIEGSQLGKNQTLTVGGVTVVLTGWQSKDGEQGEYIKFSFVVCGTGEGSGEFNDGQGGSSCASGDDCLSTACFSHVCAGTGAAGTPCTLSSDCYTDVCELGVCQGDPGSRCRDSADCADGAICDTADARVCVATDPPLVVN